jgi:hypothetical protein
LSGLLDRLQFFHSFYREVVPTSSGRTNRDIATIDMLLFVLVKTDVPHTFSRDLSHD